MDHDPDFRLAGLALTVLGPQTYSGSVDPEWLEIAAIAEAPGCRIELAGRVLGRTGFRSFLSELQRLHAELSGSAWLGSHEPDIEVRVVGDGMGHIDVDLKISRIYARQQHRIVWGIDQTELGGSIRQLERLVAKL